MLLAKAMFAPSNPLHLPVPFEDKVSQCRSMVSVVTSSFSKLLFTHNALSSHACSVFSFFMWRHRFHVGVQNNSKTILLGIWFYYYAKLEQHFVFVLYTNMAMSSCEWKPRIWHLGQHLKITAERLTIDIIESYLTLSCPRGSPLTSKIVWH